MELIEVTDSKTRKEFHKVPFVLYHNDPNWISHLKQDVERVFNREQNRFFKHGDTIRWILKDSSGNLIGRVASFINKKLADTYKQPTGGFGFFECINDQEAANLLFNSCKAWNTDQGMEAMDGPINFGERDNFWGLLIDGFTPSSYGINYNPEYYKDLFETYGLQIYYNQFVYSRKVNDPIQPAYLEKAARIKANPDYHFEFMLKSNLKKYAEDFRTIYNEAWKKHDNFKGMSSGQAISIVKKMKPVMDEDLIIFGYYKKKPVAFFVSLPELNQIFKHVRGNLNWLGKLIFLWHKWRGTCTNAFGVIFGVSPQAQGKGVEGALISEVSKRVAIKNKYENFIITWIGDFNPKMIHIVESMGTKKIKTLATYRFIFDRSKTFERSPIIR